MSGQVSTIVVISASEGERVLPLDEVATIGRSSKSDVVIDELDCSRHHAEIRRRRDGRFELVDLASRNGCFVNGVRIEGSRLLADGDRIDIAEVVLRFSQGVEAHVEATPEVEQGRPPELRCVVLAADVAAYADLTRRVAPEPLREFVGCWIEDARRVIERGGGTFDRMTDRTLIGYWRIADVTQPRVEVGQALEAVRALVCLCEDFAPLFSARFEGTLFRTALGLHLGSARIGNAGVTQDQVWTVEGPAVTAAVALEALAEERSCAAVVSAAIAEHAPADLRLHPLGVLPLTEDGCPVQALALA